MTEGGEASAGPDPEVLRRLSDQAHAFILRLSGPVRRVTIGAGSYSIEVEWERSGGPAAPVADAPAAAPVVGPPAAAPTRQRHPIVAPLVGIFYRSPEPGAPPFVEIGDVVEAGQPVAIVEAMKIMNRITAECAGTVVEIAVESGEMVEFEQVLMYLEPETGYGSPDRS